MKKLFLALLLLLMAISLSGCPTRIESGRTILFLQRGLVLSLIHDCTEQYQITQAGPGLIMNVKGSNPVQVPLVPTFWGDQTISLIVQSINENGEIVGTYVQTFWLNQNSTVAKSWIITKQQNSGFGGGGMVYRCNF